MSVSHPRVLDMLLAELQGAQGQQYGRMNKALRQPGVDAGINFKLDTGFTSSTPSSPYMHGPGGLFGVAGLNRDVISSRVHPFGLASDLPVRGTNVTNPLYPYITSFDAPTGSNPQGPCDDMPTAGPVRGCNQTAQFGLYGYQTRVLDITHNGLQTNRGEFLDLRIINDPLLQGTDDITTPNVNGSPALTREVLQRFVEVGVSFQNKLIPQLYIGNPANNTGGGGYKEFPGLDILIGTNKFDALTDTSCPALNSDIKDFNYGNISKDGTAAANIVDACVYMMRYLRWNAERMNFAPVDWSIVMRPELWYELTQAWPCAYYTYRCLNAQASTPLVIDANDVISLRDAMREGMFLLIDGVKYDVILDMGITALTNTTSNKVTSGSFASDIYIVPRTMRGGLATTYFENIDYSETAMLAVADGRSPANFYWTDGGRYLWHFKPPANWCMQWIARIEPRVILLTPQLAGRLLHVQYTPLQSFRSSFPNDPYALGGGVLSNAGPSFWSDWNH